MGKTQEYGCKKCGSVCKVDIDVWSSKVVVSGVSGVDFQNRIPIEITCKKCRAKVLTVAIMPA